MKRQKRLCLALLCTLFFTGCGKDETLDEYQANMETFFEHVAEYNDNMNEIDVSKEDYLSQLFIYLEGLNEEVTWMSELEAPEQFSAVDSLADEASENMAQAVSLYHAAYEGEEYDANLEQAAREYYDRANVRIQYIITILHGEIPEGEGVTYTEEDKIFGGGYMNQTNEEKSEAEDAGQDEPKEDDIDTDDTVLDE